MPKFKIEISSFANSVMELTISATQGKLTMQLGAEACNPLSELGKLIIDLYAVYGEPPQLGKVHPFYLFWDSGNGQYTWCFTPGHDKTISIEIHFCPDVAAGIYTDTKLQLATVASLDELCHGLVYEMKKILEIHSFNGYRCHWKQQEFPLALFLTLARHGKVNSDKPHSLSDELQQLEQIFNHKNQ